VILGSHTIYIYLELPKSIGIVFLPCQFLVCTCCNSYHPFLATYTLELAHYPYVFIITLALIRAYLHDNWIFDQLNKCLHPGGWKCARHIILIILQPNLTIHKTSYFLGLLYLFKDQCSLALPSIRLFLGGRHGQ